MGPRGLTGPAGPVGPMGPPGLPAGRPAETPIMGELSFGSDHSAAAYDFDLSYESEVDESGQTSGKAKLTVTIDHHNAEWVWTVSQATLRLKGAELRRPIRLMLSTTDASRPEAVIEGEGWLQSARSLPQRSDGVETVELSFYIFGSSLELDRLNGSAADLRQLVVNTGVEDSFVSSRVEIDELAGVPRERGLRIALELRAVSDRLGATNFEAHVLNGLVDSCIRSATLGPQPTPVTVTAIRSDGGGRTYEGEGWVKRFSLRSRPDGRQELKTSLQLLPQTTERGNEGLVVK